VRRGLYAARRTVARRLERAPAPGWPGRWGLVHRIGVWGRDVPVEERLARQARQLLQCYGIVTRQSLEGDPEGGWDWGALYRQFQLMEMRGDVRRGYFVQGLPGVQFALPEAVDLLREWTRPEASFADELVVLNACDPANVFGPAAAAVRGDMDDGLAGGAPALGGEAEPGVGRPEGDPARFSRIPSNYVVLQHGRPVLLLELGAERITSLPGLSLEVLRRAAALPVEHAGRTLRRMILSRWNGEPILNSSVAPLLEGFGFRREALDYVWEGR